MGFPPGTQVTVDELAVLICTSLQQSPAVEVDGLGTFVRDADGQVTFHDGARPRIFIAYALEDAAVAERLFRDLEARGYAPWQDRHKLLPGQDWHARIQDAIESADFFIACFSRNSVHKRGGFQAEVRYGLECASRTPLDDVFMITVRLDDCRVPARIQRETQYVDLFPDWDQGFEQILRMIEKQRVQ